VIDSRADADGTAPREVAEEIAATGTPSDADIDDVRIDAPASGDTAAMPDLATSSTCPCAPLTALLAACPARRCIEEMRKPIGIGSGSTQIARVYKPDGSLCYELHFILQAPNASTDLVYVYDPHGVVVAASSVAPGPEHNLTCGDVRAAQPVLQDFVVTNAQCPLLAKTSCADGGVP
jgi:hypothetical protein